MVPFNADKLMVKWWGKSFVRGLTAAKFLLNLNMLDIFVHYLQIGAREITRGRFRQICLSTLLRDWDIWRGISSV